MKTTRRNAKFAIIITIAIILTSVVFAETNVSILYGWNGTAFAPVNIESDGSLKTTLNLSESIGIFPKDDSLYNLGSSSSKWLTGYFANVSTTQVCIGASCRTSWPSGGSGWDISTSTYLYNNSNILDVNETKLNATINALDTNVSLQYGYNGTNWIGLQTTASGILKFLVDNTSYLARDGDTATGDYTFDSGTLFIDSLNDRVGIGTTSPNSTFQVAGNITPTLNNTYSLGEPDLVWKDVYVGNSSLYIGGQKLSNEGGNLQWNGDNVTTSADSFPSGFIGMFNDTCPSGWAYVSAFENKFPRGNDTYGATGGSDTHSHTDTLTAPAHTHTVTSNVGVGDHAFTNPNVPAHYHGFGTGSGITVDIGHTHSSSSISGSAGSGSSGHSHSVPTYYGGSATCSNVMGTGYCTAYSTESTGTDGTHTHSSLSGTAAGQSHSGNSGSVTGTIGLVTGGSNGNSAFATTGGGVDSHSVTNNQVTSDGASATALTGSIDSGDNIPAFVNVIFCIKD